MTHMIKHKLIRLLWWVSQWRERVSERERERERERVRYAIVTYTHTHTHMYTSAYTHIHTHIYTYTYSHIHINIQHTTHNRSIDTWICTYIPNSLDSSSSPLWTITNAMEWVYECMRAKVELTRSLTHSLTRSLSQSFTHLLTHLLTYSLIYSLTNWLTDSLSTRVGEDERRETFCVRSLVCMYVFTHLWVDMLPWQYVCIVCMSSKVPHQDSELNNAQTVFPHSLQSIAREREGGTERERERTAQ